ncbi:MAG: PhoH family protein [Candidatus Brocadiaceae bacterium]
MQRVLQIGGQDEVVRLFGPRDAYLKKLRDAFDVNVVARGGELRIQGNEDSVRRCEAALLQMERKVSQGATMTEELVQTVVSKQLSAPAPGAAEDLEPWPGVYPRTPGQAAYIRAMLNNDLVLCIGPAGTGKTYLGVAVALGFLKRGTLKRIVLCRPAVEVEENLGFLPGDMYAKVNPYLRPLYDALHDLMDSRRVQRYLENDLIEVLPLAFVRGRTLDNAFIILDEGQNCTVGQMKTFLTRLGTHARLLVTGDITQIDLPPDRKSGLVDAQERLRDVAGLQVVWLSEKDIVRHPLVRRILDAYQRESPPSPGDEPDREKADAEPE